MTIDQILQMLMRLLWTESGFGVSENDEEEELATGRTSGLIYHFYHCGVGLLRLHFSSVSLLTICHTK